ncbi:protein of unknown function [Burkholderia multivorans]
MSGASRLQALPLILSQERLCLVIVAIFVNEFPAVRDTVFRGHLARKRACGQPGRYAVVYRRRADMYFR